jgi:HAD superfamily hydrolase (TIGR01459 family)
MTRTDAPSPVPLIAGLSEIANRYDLLLCDVWGVLHNGQGVYADAIDALRRFRRRGGRVVLITNSPRPNGPVREQIRRLGAPDETYDDIVTSGDVTIHLIDERRGQSLHHVGPDRDLTLFDQVEAVTRHRPSLRPLVDADYVLVTGLFDDIRETPETYDPVFAAMRERNLPLVCANPDLVVHVGTELRYCAGALAERYVEQGGSVTYAGKPHAPIYEAALQRAAQRAGPVARNRVLAIGDALRTDVAGAVMQGIDALFITSGIHRDESHRTGDGQLDPDAFHAMIKGAMSRPTAAMPDLAW